MAVPVRAPFVEHREGGLVLMRIQKEPGRLECGRLPGQHDRADRGMAVLGSDPLTLNNWRRVLLRFVTVNRRV